MMPIKPTAVVASSPFSVGEFLHTENVRNQVIDFTLGVDTNVDTNENLVVDKLVAVLLMHHQRRKRHASGSS